MKLRPSEINYGNQYELDDPYGSDLGGKGYIETFLRGSGGTSPGKPFGYSFVEIAGSTRNTFLRLTGAFEEVTHTQSVMSGGDG